MFYDNDGNNDSFGMSKFVALYRSFTGLHLGSKPDFTPYRVHRVPRTRHCIHSFSPGCGRRICPALTRSNHESTALKSMQADFASEER